MEYTVIGFWFNDQAIVAGVVRGTHTVLGGAGLENMDDSSFQGPWAWAGKAPTPDEAEARAVAEMEAAELALVAELG